MSLVDVGPVIQENQDALRLLATTPAVVWTLLVSLLMFIACVGTLSVLKENLA